jgi:hypothetical protein
MKDGRVRYVDEERNVDAGPGEMGEGPGTSVSRSHCLRHSSSEKEREQKKHLNTSGRRQVGEATPVDNGRDQRGAGDA